MGYFHNKKLWIMSLLRNNAQHRKLRSSIDFLQNQIDKINHNLINNFKKLNEQNNILSQTYSALKDKNMILEKENQNLKNQIQTNFNFLRKLTPQANLEFVEIHLVEHCNLNCFGCNHFSQLANEGYTDINEYDKDMKQLAKITGGGINRFHLMGGEPLLHPSHNEFFKITRKYFPKSQIWLVTNGILLESRDDEFWQTCKDEKIQIHPTKYPIKINWNFIENKCKEYGIPLIFYNNANIEKTSYQLLLDRNGKQDPFRSFINCHQANCCIRFHKGKLCTCTVAVSIEHFNKKFNSDFPMDENNYLDIYKVENYSEILRFLAQPIPFCRYCKMGEWKSIGSWRRSKKIEAEYTQEYKE
ncbi:radical SAM protein [Campylobacter lanienae]|uniref:radical SAM protein n=3 Tax=Campylobacter TaxID=194 RepID=UPI000BB44F4A|nr:4Fe-4S cluster-binding domain-containing protein [Campylobacter lanienae]MDD5785531.1 4Fe-4S cluster-binding domain-containing protein [Campylobacter lanienae]